MRELVERREVHARRAGVFGHPRLFEQRAECIALVVADGDDAPGGELAMVGSAQRAPDYVLALPGLRPARDHLARLPRTARGTMREHRCAVVDNCSPTLLFSSFSLSRALGRATVYYLIS